MHRNRVLLSLGLVCALALGASDAALAGRDAGPRDGYQQLLAKERALTARGRVPSLSQLRTLLVQYEQFVGRYPRSGYADNALWQAAQIAAMLHARSKRADDRQTAVRLLDQLTREYPSSSLLPRVEAARAELTPRPPASNGRNASRTDQRAGQKATAASASTNASTRIERAPLKPAASRAPAVAAQTVPAGALPASRTPGGVSPSGTPTTAAHSEPLPSNSPRAIDDLGPPGVVVATRDAVIPSPEPDVSSAPVAATAAGVTTPAVSSPISSTTSTTRHSAPSATLVDIRRVILPELVRITIELDREATYRDERVEGPPRAVFEFAAAQPSPALEDALLSFKSDIVRQIRVGEQPGAGARVVLDLAGAERYSAFTLYNPYRLVVDVFRKGGPQPAVKPSSPAPTVARTQGTSNNGSATWSTLPSAAPPLPATMARAPESAAATADGSYSIARQLGLGVSRIVIDPGHGGHDPGALGKKVTEAELVLDVALRLEKLLRKTAGFDVVLTRRTDVFVALEERTAMANRAKADLFLSIHANASRNPGARGIETYVLNFALNPEAEAVAARENAASGRSMHQLPDIVKAIALNNKLDESRELARMVQGSLVQHVRGDDEGVRDLGVKQAPFVVLIGAGMPSVLAEISFITNPKDAELLRISAHRQKIAESLYESILKYQRTLKSTDAVASIEPPGRGTALATGR